MSEIMDNIFLGILFLSAAFFDIKFKALPRWFLVVAFIGSFCMYLWKRPVTLWEIAGAVAVGIVLLFISFVTKGALGAGDGLFLMIAGILLGGTRIMEILGLGIFLSGFVSCVLLIFKKVSRKTALPFIPFLLLSYGIILSGQMGGMEW